jgi:hypothetical protein
MKKIIVLQTSHSGYEDCEQRLTALGLVRGQDFRVYDDRKEAVEAVVAGERQLFITGTFHGRTQGIAEMLHAGRTKNPNLVCASFSLDKLPGSFDVRIAKGRESREFEATVQAFLDGKLKRTTPAFWNAEPDLLKKIRNGTVKRRIVVVERSVEALVEIKTAVATIDPVRAEEILFTQSPDEVIQYIGDEGGAVVVMGSLFSDHYPETFWGGSNLAIQVSRAKTKWRGMGFSNVELLHGRNPQPDGELNGVIRDEGDWADTLARILVMFQNELPEQNTDALLKELRAIEEKYPVLDQMACIRLRPCCL